MELHIIKGPSVSKVSRVAAEKKLKEMPEIKTASSWKLRDIEGVWVAAVAMPEPTSKVAAPPPFAPSEEEPPAAPGDEGPPSDGPPSDEGDAPDDSEAPDDDKGDDDGKDEKGKGGIEHQVAELTHMLHTLMSALGLDAGGPEGPMGHEGEPGMTPPGPSGPSEPGVGADNKTHTVHERALKPGEAPPGTLPVGSPSFASTHPDHPWKDVVGVKRSFTLEEPIGDRTMASVREELNTLAAGTGYTVKRAKEGLNKDNIRVARVLVQAETPVS